MELATRGEVFDDKDGSLALRAPVAKWSLTSLQRRLVKTGGRLIQHARYYWLLLWAFQDNRIAVRFAYEWHDDSGNWFRSFGNEN